MVLGAAGRQIELKTIPMGCQARIGARPAARSVLAA